MNAVVTVPGDLVPHAQPNGVGPPQPVVGRKVRGPGGSAAQQLTTRPPSGAGHTSNIPHVQVR